MHNPTSDTYYFPVLFLPALTQKVPTRLEAQSAQLWPLSSPEVLLASGGGDGPFRSGDAWAGCDDVGGIRPRIVGRRPWRMACKAGIRAHDSQTSKPHPLDTWRCGD